MEREWRCKKCSLLRGVERGARLHVRYQQAQYVQNRPKDLDAWTAENKAQSPTHQGVVR